MIKLYLKTEKEKRWISNKILHEFPYKR